MKDILVQLDSGSQSALRLKVAIELAARRKGRVIGLFAQVENYPPSVVARRASDALKSAADEARQAFEAAIGKAGVAGKWWQLAHGEAGHVVSETVFCARYADLVILGQHHPELAHIPAELIEQVVLNAGRPVLVIPHSGDVASLGERIAIAWNASREASRAVHDAMPLLQTAKELTVLSIRDQVPADRSAMDSVPQVDIKDHLALHGLKIQLERMPSEELGVMDMLLSRSFDLGADLLVMGAHSGLGLSFMRGAGTRFMLRHMTVPILMSH